MIIRSRRDTLNSETYLKSQGMFFPSNEQEKVYDAIVIGAGPAGLASAIYLARANKKILILEAERAGGRLMEAKFVENYPGFASISGVELAERMVNQAKSAGAEILYPARAIRFALLVDPKLIWTREKEYYAKAVILAIGVQRKRLEITGARELLGTGVSYCPVCDGTLFKDQDVALIGEDEETISDGLYLSAIVNKINLIPGTLTPHYKLESLKTLLSKGNVKIWQTFEAVQIIGSKLVEKVKVKDLKSNAEQMVNVSGVFISGEKTPITEMLATAGLKTDSLGCIVTDQQGQTNISDVYAAGDATCSRKYQIAVSVGQGVNAAMNIIRRQTGGQKSRE
jgi:thioredoxin reductase (NADPH)